MTAGGCGRSDDLRIFIKIGGMKSRGASVVDIYNLYINNERVYNLPLIIII